MLTKKFLNTVGVNIHVLLINLNVCPRDRDDNSKCNGDGEIKIPEALLLTGGHILLMD